MIGNLMVPENYNHTQLNCPSASYRYNYGTYSRSKYIFMGIAIIGIILSGCIVFSSNSAQTQTLFATILGGFINIVVWLFTTLVTDKMAQERDEIDRLIGVIDQHISELHKDIIMEDRKTYVREKLPSDIIFGRVIWFQQNCFFLACDKDIDSSKLRLNWEGTDCSLDEFLDLIKKLLDEHLNDLTEQHSKMIEWNVYHLDQQLRCLRNKMLLYKSYISSKSPPLPKKR